MDSEDRKYRAICFDLDGTLLGMDIDEFMTEYFSRIAIWAGKNGMDSKRFIEALKSGTKAMALSNDDSLNKDVFWKDFYEAYGEEGLEGIDVLSVANEFYANVFNHIGDDFDADPLVAETIVVLKEKGYPLVLTTMPMFPLQAVKHRLGWAGVDHESFDRITTYENSKTTKPRQTYFAENLAAMGLNGSDVLMVGNNTMEDMAFLDLGADGYLITDWLLDPIGYDLSTIKHGSFKEFSEWAKSLPDCENPAVGISNDPIDYEDMAKAYRSNIRNDLDPASMDENAKRLANAIESDVPLGKE